MFHYIRKTVTTILIVSFIGSLCPQVQAGEMTVPAMPVPGTMVTLSSAYTPAQLTGLTIHSDNPLRFDFLIQKGDGNLTPTQKKIEYKKLVKYFLAALTVPEKDQWVNLSPFEQNRIVEDNFGKTEMGRDLLAQDYLLKQITSSLMYPESGLGKEFWTRVYEKVDKANVPVNTFNKVWIMPDRAQVYEKGDTVYVLENHLKVMLEEDYLSLQKHADIPAKMGTQTAASKVIREIILPELEKEINEGKNFANLRQVYSGMILATWYKTALKESILNKVYANKSKVAGVNQDPKNNEKIYQTYLTAFKKGVFNYIKEDLDQTTQQAIPRKYFAGGGTGIQNVIINHAMAEVKPSVVDAAMRTYQKANGFDQASVALGIEITGRNTFQSEEDLRWIKILQRDSINFTVNEFGGTMTPTDLIDAIQGISIPDTGTPIERLNGLLKVEKLYTFMAKHPDTSKGAIDRLKRGIPLAPQELIQLNRNLISANYPKAPKIRNKNNNQVIRAQQYLDKKYGPSIKGNGIKFFYLAKLISEKFAGIKFDGDIDDFIKESYVATWQAFLEYKAGNKQKLGVNISVQRHEHFSNILRRKWNLREFELLHVQALLQALNEIMRFPGGVLNEEVELSGEEILELLLQKSPSLLITVLRIKRFLNLSSGIAQAHLEHPSTGDYDYPPEVMRFSYNRMLREKLSALRPREERVLRLRTGYRIWGEVEEQSLEEIGGSLGISGERVRQIESRTLRGLRFTFHPDMSNDWFDALARPSPEVISTKTPTPERTVLPIAYLDNEEMMILLNGLGGDPPYSYEEVAVLWGLTSEEVMAKENKIIHSLKNGAVKELLNRNRKARIENTSSPVSKGRKALIKSLVSTAVETGAFKNGDLTIEEEKQLLNLIRMRGKFTAQQWHLLPQVLEGHTLKEILALNNNKPWVEEQRRKVLQRLRFLFSLGVLEHFGSRRQVTADLIRLSTESPFQRLVRHTGIDDLLAISQGDIQGIVELIMELYPDVYDEQEVRAQLDAEFDKNKSSYPRRIPLERTLTAIHRVSRIHAQGQRERTILKIFIRDRLYQVMASSPKTGLALLKSEIVKSPKDVFWNNLLNDVYDYYDQATAFTPRGFRNIQGNQPLLPAQRFGIWQSIGTLSDPRYNSSVHMSEARIGKTIMAVLAAFNVREPISNAFAVKTLLYTTSNSAKYEVAEELRKRTDLNLHIIVVDGEQGDRKEQIKQAVALARDKNKNVVLIANYESVRDFPAEIVAFRPDAHIIDEVENLKGGEDTIRAPIIFAVPSIYRIGISARPVINNAKDVAELLLWTRHYTGGPNQRESAVAKARLELKRLNAEDMFSALAELKVRWRRSVVMPEVKAPVEETEYIPYSPEEAEHILAIRDNFDQWRSENAKPRNEAHVNHVFTRYQLERQASVNLNLVVRPDMIDSSYESSKFIRLDEIIAAELKNNGKVVVLVDFVPAVGMLEERYNARYAPGTAEGVSSIVLLKNRQEIIRRFRGQNNPKILIGTSALLGSSLNLFQMPGTPFHISLLVRISQPWVPFDDADRLVGIGQNEWVRAITLVSQFRPETTVERPGIRTIDEGVLEMVRIKRQIFQRVIDGSPIVDDAALQEFARLAPAIIGGDAAMKGGIDMASQGMDFRIKRDGKGIPLPQIQEDIAQLSQIPGFDPQILEITPVINLPLVNELREKARQSSPAYLPLN